MNPKVSICIPVYNVESYIEECLHSIVLQTYSNIEIVIVNDCTPDNSMEIIKKYIEKDPRIKVCTHDRNKGLMRARETGYRAAEGEYITFCDSDDTLPLNSIETLVNAALQSRADIVSGDMQQFSKEQVFQPISAYLPYGSDSEAVYKALLSKKYYHSLGSKLFKRELFSNHTYITYDNVINGEDGILFYQILKYTKKVIHIPKIVYNYRKNPQSSTNQRLKPSGVFSVLLLLSIRQDCCNLYSSLRDDAWRYNSYVINELIANGYDKFVDLRRMLKELNLLEYVDIRHMCKYMPYKQCFKIILLNIFKPYYYLRKIRRI